jgi:glycosyltransferase involved in cell wall biosynthesis
MMPDNSTASADVTANTAGADAIREAPLATVAVPPPRLSATVAITTKNRKDELAAAIESALSQTAQPEILVIDDGSTDGTSEMVRQRFPSVRLDRVEQSLGLIAQRNRAAKMAAGDIIFSIDDDAVFTTPRVVAQTLADFDHPKVGAVGIPFIDVRKNDLLQQRAPADEGVFATFNYIGTAHALRRDVFLAVGGYREFLFHQGEESDYCIRMLDAGYIVRLGRADPIHHMESPRRDFTRMDLYGRRNDILFAWYNVPAIALPLHLAATTFNGIRMGFKCGRPLRMARGLLNGYAAVFRQLSKRAPVRPETYRLSRRLKRGALEFRQIESELIRV